MLAETTHGTCVKGGRLTGEGEKLHGLMKRGMSGVTQALVPEINRGHAGEVVREGRGRVRSHAVQIAIRVTSENHQACAEVLHREAKHVKFDRNRVLTSKLTNR